MMLKTRPALSDHLLELQAQGRVSFTREEAIKALGITEAAFLKSAKRLEKRGRLLNPRQGFYVAIPPQYMSWEGPPPNWYIDALMQHEGRSYYVGLLKAAELHGATHHAVIEFQVIADKQLPRIRAGRSIIAFYYRKDLGSVQFSVVDHKTDTGSMKLSSPELTAFDLLRYAHAVGGIDAIATVLSDLKDRLDGRKLANLARQFERAVCQRLGYLLDWLGASEKTSELHSALFAKRPMPWAALEPQKRGQAATKVEPVERSERWRLLVYRKPEIDE